ncbi:MAG TPA: DNA alkylation repair protein [Anaerolineaceae bacterium]|nr:DNA alkylation repair protein [Anaerolineaceae bacterium]HPS33475.1 DNA alkylation repair protein [Anaerolineaceae bacterium]
MSSENWSELLFQALESAPNPEKAPAMEAYMKHNFRYLGLPSPRLMELAGPHLKAASQQPGIDWDFVQAAWQKPYREAQYCACAYLSRVRARLTAEDLPALKRLVQTKSWWDSVDTLSGIIGSLVLRCPALKQDILAWSLDQDLWTRRAAIIHQLEYKKDTDTALLEQILLNNLGTREFFINKAVGWSLRQYSRTDPAWVAAFVRAHEPELANLSKKEARKYLPPET